MNHPSPLQAHHEYLFDLTHSAMCRLNVAISTRTVTDELVSEVNGLTAACEVAEYYSNQMYCRER